MDAILTRLESAEAQLKWLKIQHAELERRIRLLEQQNQELRSGR